MKQIHSLDQQIDTFNTIDHPSVVHGYRIARVLNLDTMILADFGLRQHEVPAIIESLRKHGIEQVAVTDTSSDLMGLMWGFAKTGATYKMDLIDTGREETFETSRIVPGFIITLN